MELTLMASSSSSSSSSSSAHLLPRVLPLYLLRRENYDPRSSNWLVSHRLQLDERARRSLVVAGAKKKKKNDKADDHVFVPRPDEATGPFPEAVLLKKKVAKEDGRVLPEFADAEEEKLFEFLNLQLESDLNLEKMRHYEVVYLIHEDHADEVQSIISKVEEFIREKKGRIWRLNDWGLRRLAYKIRKAEKANYILMNFALDAKYINDFKSMLDKDERVIRHLVIKRDKAITEDCPPPPVFHTLRGEGMDDEDNDDIDIEDQVWDDGEDELEDYNGIDDDDAILINDDEDEIDDVAPKTKKSLKLEGATR